MFPGERGFGGPPPEAVGMNDGARGDAPAALPNLDRAEVLVEYARSSGAGGQNVNKRDTKAVIHWNVGKAGGFTEEQKAAIRAFAGKRLSGDDEIVMYDQTQRSREQNRENALERLEELVRDALTPEKERRATKVPRVEKKKRLQDKRHNAERKANRRTEGEW